MIQLILLVPLAGAGISLMNAGLCRSRSAAHSMLGALCVASVAAIVCVLEMAGVRSAATISAIAPQVLFSAFAAATAAIIPLGSGADRWRLGASCISASILAGGAFSLFSSWTSGAGWLGQRGFADAGGAASIHAVGGVTALAIAWILGPRRGKYNSQGMPTAIPGHNTVLVLLGCWVAWIGLMALNATGAAPERVALAALNTTVSAAAGALAAAAITRARFGKTDASLCANGWAAGLVSASAGCAIMPPAGAILVGLSGGALTIYTIEWLELHLSVDDPGGAISVHAGGGMWSLLAAGLFSGNWVIQVVGITTLLGCVLPISFGLNWLLNRFYRQRVSPEAERQGLDLYELGAGAYPDFLTHNEDSWLR